MIMFRGFLQLVSGLQVSATTRPTRANILFLRSKIKKRFFKKMSNLGASNAFKDNMNKDEFEYIEGVVCRVSDINENEMKQFDLDKGKVLLYKQNGTISAVGSNCTHYGAPLVNGALGQGRVRCPWHGACFNLKTGDIEDFPGLDSLPCYKVTIEGNNVKVRAKKVELETNKRIKPMVKRNRCEGLKIVVIGGGPSAANCVETLRQEGFKGQVTMVCKENCLPYDRVKVNKQMDFDISQAQFRTDKFYVENSIDVFKGVEALSINTNNDTVLLSNGNTLEYDKLYIATGCKARKLNIPGSDLANVVVLREYVHSQSTQAQLGPEKEIVILGSSFIAMEAASYCSDKVKKVTLVMRDELPFLKTLGENIGSALMKLFKDKGVNFATCSNITKMNGDANGIVTEVELTDGSKLKADLVILGTGITYYTDFVKGSNVQIRENGTIETDDTLKTNVANVYAGGDIAHAPIWSHDNKKTSIGHFGLAHYHGRIAALNMLGKETKMKAVPFFWTMMFGKSVRYAGHGEYDDIIYVGSVENLKFVAFYLKNDLVVAASSCGMDPIVSHFAERLAQGKKLYRNDIKDDPLAWTEIK